jgi:iron complex transport system ATP-binding protein
MSDGIVATGVGVRRGARSVLRAVDFRAPAASVTAVLGPNGAGKSSLIEAVAGLVPFSGAIRVDGVDVAALSPLERALRVAYVPQQSLLSAPLAVEEVVALGRYAHARGGERSEARARAVQHALDKTRAAALAKRPFSELSGGEQRRVLVARAVATGARTLLLDEPTASLDVQHALGLFALCRELAAEGRTIVIVLHQLTDALRFADHVLLLHQGSVVAAGAAADVLVHARVREVYGVHMIPTSAPSFASIEAATATERALP